MKSLRDVAVGLSVLAVTLAGCAARSLPSPMAGRTGEECLIAPAFDEGIGELYLCERQAAERHLIGYARMSFGNPDLREDIWVNFRGVFNNRVWVNLGFREANDTSVPALPALAQLLPRMAKIREGDTAALEDFLAPIAASPAATDAERTLQQRLLVLLRTAANESGGEELGLAIYHVHLKPTQEIQDRSVMPINHFLSIPSHTDLLYVPRIKELAQAHGAVAVSRFVVAAGIWEYDFDPALGERFVAKQYRERADAPYALKFGHVYTRFAIPAYHALGLNDPEGITPTQVTALIDRLKPTGAVLRFRFAPDWERWWRQGVQASRSPVSSRADPVLARPLLIPSGLVRRQNDRISLAPLLR